MMAYLALCLLGLLSSSNALLKLFSLPPSSSKVSVSELKQQLIEKTRNTQNGIALSTSKDPGRLNEVTAIINQLNKRNRNTAISTSPLLDGTWKLAFTTNTGSSAGKLGPLVGSVVQEIYFLNSPQYYINKVLLLNGLVEAALTADWTIKSKDLWEVNFKEIQFKVLGIPLVKKELKATGIWRLTYCDNDMRILYAKGGKNVTQENVYILFK